MALYVTYKRETGDTEYSVVCHTGMGKLDDVIGLMTEDTLISIQADSDELTKIVHNLSHIPWSTAAVNIWHGEFANFIYHNLTL